MKTSIRALAAALMTASSLSFAANDGTVGTTTSNGDLEINLTIPERIVVAQLDDITLSTVFGNDAVGEDTFCVGGTGFATFGIQFDSEAGGSGEYLLESLATPGQTLRYTVGFSNDDTATTPTATPVAGTPVPGNNRQDYRCGAGRENAKLFVSVLADDWQSADEGPAYNDTLTITVTAE